MTLAGALISPASAFLYLSVLFLGSPDDTTRKSLRVSLVARYNITYICFRRHIVEHLNLDTTITLALVLD